MVHISTTTTIVMMMLLSIQILISLAMTVKAAYRDDPCVTQSMPGICKAWSGCPIIKVLVENGVFTPRTVEHCGFDITEELICCPLKLTDISIGPIKKPPRLSPMRDSSLPLQSPPRNSSNTANNDLMPRISIRACQKYERNLSPVLTPHILDGVPAYLGEFPHMAAIGYSDMGDDQPPYQIRCGGSLISERFILTAAHCISSLRNVPRIVRLGVVNFDDPEEMKSAVEIRIKKIHIPPHYHSWEAYNDIALLELERVVELTYNIYPTCLHTDESDPAATYKLVVIGWGVTNVTTKMQSNILLKVPLDIAPLSSCNESYVKYGLTRKLYKGVIESQVCTLDLNLKKDACQGDSGGPLNLIINKTNRQYRLVGIVSTGLDCASRLPGLYTRVSAFLDFIESIVWPNGIV